MQFAPTVEQENALLFYRTGSDLVIEAAAGSGKTSTLELLARYAPHRRGLYLAFNKAVAMEAASRFAGTGVRPMTMHALALSQVGGKFRHRLDTASKFVPWGVIAKRLGIDEDFRFAAADVVSTKVVRREQITRCAQDTVNRFMASADMNLNLGHVVLPKALVTTDNGREQLSAMVLDHATTIWADWENPEGSLPIRHNTYLKSWQLTSPKLSLDFIALDECQDADPLMLSILLNQDCQRILVGDEAQSIYAWRGATSAMQALPEANRAQLTQSFRFGPEVAAEAQKWLNFLGSDMTITGNPGKRSTVGERVYGPDAVICRTNAGAIVEVLDALEAGVRVGIAGERKAQELVKLAKAAVDLKDKGRTSHPDFQIFASWDELSDYSKTDDGMELASFVGLVNRFGGKRMVKAIESCNMQTATLVVSTAHVAKGLEWGSVQVADDFSSPKANVDGVLEYRAEEARLAYVTVTRAKERLGTGDAEKGLAWINQPGNVDLV